MALGKYKEEIQERLITNTSERYEKHVAELFEQFPSSSLLAGDVYLTRGDRRMEDIEVCEAGHALELLVVSASGALEPEVEVSDDRGSRKVRLTSGGKLKLPFSKPGTLHVQVSSGGYVKEYTIHAVEPFSAEELPDFAKLIRSLADNPPNWSETTFSEFRSRLEGVLNHKSAPQTFTQGIIEYHFALYQEEQRNPLFRDRLQAAYGSLRWFIPYSDVARLICIYYLFCANEFEAAKKLCNRRRGRLSNAVSFFLQKRSGKVAAKVTTTGTQKTLPLLIALADVLTFNAIDALAEGKALNAQELAAVARVHIHPNSDRERNARNTFLEARCKVILGDIAGATSMLEGLKHSPWPSIATASSKLLNQIANG